MSWFWDDKNEERIKKLEDRLALLERQLARVFGLKESEDLLFEDPAILTARLREQSRQSKWGRVVERERELQKSFSAVIE